MRLGKTCRGGDGQPARLTSAVAEASVHRLRRSPGLDPELVRFARFDADDAELFAGGRDETILEAVGERVADELLIWLGVCEAEPVADPFDAAAAGDPGAQRHQVAPVPEVAKVIGGAKEKGALGSVGFEDRRGLEASKVAVERAEQAVDRGPTQGGIADLLELVAENCELGLLDVGRELGCEETDAAGAHRGGA
jgi:hypothetical protein